ncbi:hypothetical protein ACPYO6_01765 [Georgenia sp. Z1344]|uniref:hypothetical protein n=1 Tax=Georgenia sp. Z1344 TaxID=3416706 RepID=UPI003CE7018E
MSYLGTHLDLEPGARVTGISVGPSSDALYEHQARFFLHRIRIPGGRDGADVAGALARFLPSAVATMSGVEPDGGAWCAVVQYVPEVGLARLARQSPTTPRVRVARNIARAGLERAQDLTGTRGEVLEHVFTDIEARKAFRAEGAEDDDWDAISLLIALLYELPTEVDLNWLDDEISDPALDGRELHAHRLTELSRLLGDWAVTNHGTVA